MKDSSTKIRCIKKNYIQLEEIDATVYLAISTFSKIESPGAVCQSYIRIYVLYESRRNES